jgi:hypothetical protein
MPRLGIAFALLLPCAPTFLPWAKENCAGLEVRE